MKRALINISMLAAGGYAVAIGVSLANFATNELLNDIANRVANFAYKK